jgi:V8-like Glu-specific endopeptidase
MRSGLIKVESWGLRVVVVGALLLIAHAGGFAAEPTAEDPAVVDQDRVPLGTKVPSALQMPEELRNWPNLEPPGARGESRLLAEDPTQTVAYDPLTGTEVVVTYPWSPGEPGTVEGFEGLYSMVDAGESIIGADDRTLVTSVTTFPWSTVVKLYITASDGANGICSGEMIDAFHVMTAGHCAFLHDHGGWASSIRIVPGMDQTYWPYNYAWATNFRSYTGWTVDENHQHDWAVLTLDRNVGSFTGWMGRWTGDPSHSWYTGTLNVAGYPGDLDGGERMYYDSDTGRTADEFNHWYYMDTADGMSGAPVWVYSSGNRYITTVHAYGNDGSGSNHGTRLNQNKYDMINTWLGQDTPPTDRADLVDDGATWSGFSPSTVTRDVTSFTAWNDTRNVGTASSGSFYVDFYASTNPIISTGDRFIGRTLVSSISPFSFADVSWNGTFPQAIPAGAYYVGWILDASSVVTEFDEANNTAVATGTVTVLDPCSLDAYEPDNTPGTASPFTVNTTQTHSMCLEGDVDWVIFYLAEESTLSVATSGATGDTVLELQDSGFNVVGFDDDGGPGLFSLITGVYAAGTYYARAWEFSNDDYILSYNLTVSAVATGIFSDGFESGNTSAWN